MYLLGIGLLLGLLLGPAVLGRIAPETYAFWFTGTGEAAATIHAFDLDTFKGLQQLTTTGVSQIAVEEYAAQRAAERQALPEFSQALIERQQHKQAWMGRLMALVLTVIVVMGLEAWAGPRPLPERGGRAVVSPTLGRLVTIRYALIALWMTLALANPAALLDAPWGFVAALLFIALLIGLVPLGNRSITKDAKTPPTRA